MKRVVSKSSKELFIKLHKKWYSLSEFASSHPGGIHVLKSLHMRDGTRMFDMFAHSPRAIAMMKQFEMKAEDTAHLYLLDDDNTVANNVGNPDDRKSFNLFDYASLVLSTKDSVKKADLTLEAWAKWKNSELSIPTSDYKAPVALDHPERDVDIKIVNPDEFIKSKDPADRRLRLIHACCHIESFAIDLSWDIILRYRDSYIMPLQFYFDWLKVAMDEAKHFYVWRNRLLDMGSKYGSFSVHEGLWQSASVTSHSLPARLAIVHMVHEARGLDMAKRMKAKFVGGGDNVSAKFFDEIERDEITHVECGMRWFQYCCKKEGKEPISEYHSLVKKYFDGSLRPPFNHAARLSIGMTPEWYEPLVDDRWKKK